MQQTTRYQFNIVEGSDIVNPLTQLNPNFTKLDNLLYGQFSQVTFTTAIETVSGTVHALTRNFVARTFIKFTATNDWNEGDSMTLDGDSVTVIMPDGSTPTDKCYVTGASVLCFVTGTTVTLFASQKYIPTASEVTTTDGDTVQDYIDNTKFKNLETWTPNIGENWETFLARIRDNSTKTIPANFIRCTVDGISGLIFRQSRRTSATSWQYETDYFTGNSLVKYAMSVGSDSAVLRKYDILNGTVQNLSSADAQIINIYGLDV